MLQDTFSSAMQVASALLQQTKSHSSGSIAFILPGRPILSLQSDLLRSLKVKASTPRTGVEDRKV